VNKKEKLKMTETANKDMTHNRLVCSSCGSSDITLKPPYYYCNHCKSKYLLPQNPLEADENVLSWLKRRYIVVVSLLVVLMLFVGYLAFFERSPVLVAPHKTTASKSTEDAFKNIVFSKKNIKNILDFVQMPCGDFLVVGQAYYSGINLMRLSPSGALLFEKKIAKGFYAHLVVGEDNSYLVASRTSQSGELIRFGADNRILFRKSHLATAIVADKYGFVSIHGGVVEAFTHQGELRWRHVIDHKKITRRAGASLNRRTGKMEPYVRTTDRLGLRKIVRLKHGQLMVVGKENTGKIVLAIIDDKEGKVIHVKKFDFGHTYIDTLIATSDGGSLLVARDGLRLFKFDEVGTLQWRKKANDRMRNIYTYSVVENKEGYLIASTVGKDAQIQLMQVDKEANKIRVHRYRKKNLRLHPKKLLPLSPKGYLLAVTTETHESWIVRVHPDGTLDANMDDPSLPATQQTDQTPRTHEAGADVFAGARKLAVSVYEKIPPKRVATTEVIGSRILQSRYSPDGKYIFVTRNAMGFGTLKREDDGRFRAGKMVQQSLTKLRIQRHRISPANGKIPKHGTPYDYDRPGKFVISPDTTRAYVSDLAHGFYVADITKPLVPVTLSRAGSFRCSAFDIDFNNGVFYYADNGMLRAVPLEKMTSSQDEIRCQTSSSTSILELDTAHKRAIVVNDKEVLLYDIGTMQRIATYRADAPIGRVYGWLEKEGLLYLVLERQIEIIQIKKDNTFAFVSTVSALSYIDSIQPIDATHFCYAQKEGVVCVDIKDKLDPTTYARYINDAHANASTLALSPDKKKLFIGFVNDSAAEALLE
jgi:hypothetical protein